MGRLFRRRFLLKRRDISSHIRSNRRRGVFGYVSTVLLLALIISILSPVYFAFPNTEATAKDPTPSTLVFNSISTTASVILNVDNPSGTFNSSANDGTNASFSISTNNATGYTVSLKVDNNGATSLSNGTDSIPTISTAGITADNFTANTWGILPSKYNSINNTTNYYPASTVGFIMDETTVANATANNYTVGLGIKMDFTAPTGTYTNSALVIEYVANPVTYSISYSRNANVTTITGMPSPNPQSGTISQGTMVSSVTLASAPERTGYTFIGWCMGTSSSTNTTTTDGVDVCGNAATNQFEAGQSFGINATGTSPDTYYLYAMWSANSYTCTKQYRLQNADGTWGEYVADGTEQIKFGSTCSYSKTVANYKNSANGTNNSTATTSVVMDNTDGIIASLDLYRNTFTCKISYRYQNVDSNYGNTTVAVNTTKRYGEVCSWSTASISNFDSTTYQATNYTNDNITANVDQTVSINRNTVTITKQYRLQGTDGNYPSTYTADGTATALYGSTYTYSRTATTSHQSASKTSGTITNDTTVSLDVPRKTVTVTKQYKLQGTDGNYPSAYTSDGTVDVLYGANYTYSKTATTTHQAASTSISNVTSAQTVSLNIPRKTVTITKQYRLQDTSGNYPSAYTSDGTVDVLYGANYTYSKTATTTHQAASTSISNVTSAQAISLSVPRQLVTCNKQYKLENADGTWTSYTPDGSVNAYYGGTCSYSKTVTNYRGSSTAANGAQGTTSASNVTTTQILSLDFYRNTFTCLIKYQLQNANGSYATATNGINSTMRYGQTCSWSRAADATYKAASYSTTITANVDQTVNVDRNTFTCKISYKYQAANGSYGNATVAVNTTKRYGEACSWSTSSISNFDSTTYKSASYTNNNITANVDQTVSIERNTVTCTKRFKLQNANGGYPANYTTDGTETVLYGGNCSYAKTVTDYNGNAAMTVSASNVTEAQYLSLDFPRNTYALTINRNTTYISSVSGAGNTYRWGQSISISATPASNSAFNGWSQTAGTAGTFGNASNASTTFTMPKSAATIYADGKFSYGECEDDPESCMQTMTTCTTTAKTVTDSRDGSTYMVRKLADNNCWMLDNLALDLTDATIVNSLNVNNTNASNTTLNYLRNGGGEETDKYPMTGLSLSDWTQDTYSYSAPLVNSVYKDTTSHENDTFANANTWKFGVYYNYCAASAGSYCYGNGKTSKPSSGNATEDVCPKGWRMPTGDTTDGEFWLLYDTYYNHNYSDLRTAFRTPSSSYIVQGDLYNPYGREGRWWTSTRHSSESIWFYSLSTQTSSFGDSGTYRYYGNSVRCILK